MSLSDTNDSTTLTGAEFAALAALMGLNARKLGDVYDVQERTARRWITGKNYVPASLDPDPRGWVDAYQVMVGEVGAAPAPVGGVHVVYGTDRALWDAHPDWWPLTATAHAAHVATIVDWAAGERITAQ